MIKETFYILQVLHYYGYHSNLLILLDFNDKRNCSYVQHILLDDCVDYNADQQVEEGCEQILQPISVVNDQLGIGIWKGKTQLS